MKRQEAGYGTELIGVDFRELECATASTNNNQVLMYSIPACLLPAVVLSLAMFEAALEVVHENSHSKKVVHKNLKKWNL